MGRRIKPALPEEFAAYESCYLVRTRGNAIQELAVGVSRGGWLQVYPTLYVAGADLADDGIDQTVSLATRDWQRWQFAPGTPLDDALAREILERLRSDSPVSFETPLDDTGFEHALRWFGRRGSHWSPDLFLAFFSMTRGAASARADLKRAADLFRRHSRLGSGRPLRDWEGRLHERLQALEGRLDATDCVGRCREESESHAGQLGLPPLVWPPEWPESVPPWPRKPTRSGLGRFLGRG